MIQIQHLWYNFNIYDLWCDVTNKHMGGYNEWVWNKRCAGGQDHFSTDAHGDVAGEWFLGPELQLRGWTSCSYESNAYLGVWHSSKHTAAICIDYD